MKKNLLFLALFAMCLSFTAPVSAANYLARTIVGERSDVEINVMSANVIDGVLIVTMRYKNIGEKGDNIFYAPDDTYILAGGKKYTVMKDLATNKYLAAPMGSARRRVKGKYQDLIGLHLGKGDKGIVWIKFAAPPVGFENVELLIPKTSPLTFKISR